MCHTKIVHLGFTSLNSENVTIFISYLKILHTYNIIRYSYTFMHNFVIFSDICKWDLLYLVKTEIAYMYVLNVEPGSLISSLTLAFC